MIRRIWNVIRDSFTPQPERFTDSADIPYMAATIEAPAQAAPLQAASIAEQEYARPVDRATGREL